MTEIWKPINGYNNYFISNFGNVKSYKNRILKQQKDNKGYLRISITENRVKKTFKVHRLVAEHFLDNPYNKPQVNHIDGNKENNCYLNLEYCTNLENAEHAIKNGLWTNVFKTQNNNAFKSRKRIVAYSVDNTIEFESIKAAEKYFNSRHISEVLSNKRKSVKGYSFLYKKEVI